MMQKFPSKYAIFIYDQTSYCECEMYANYDLPNVGTVIRRSLFESNQRISVSQNSTVRSIEQSWFVRIKLGDFWTKIFTSNVYRCISNYIINHCLLY